MLYMTPASLMWLPETTVSGPCTGTTSQHSALWATCCRSANKLVLASDLNRAILSHQVIPPAYQRHPALCTDMWPFSQLRKANMMLRVHFRGRQDSIIQLLQGGQEKSPLERLMRQLVGD